MIFRKCSGFNLVGIPHFHRTTPIKDQALFKQDIILEKRFLFITQKSFEKFTNYLRIDSQVRMSLLKLQNTISTGLLCVEIRLEELGLKYQPKKFAAAILKLEKTTVLLFKNGKFVVTGAKSEEIARESAKQTLLFIISHGYVDARIENFRINNMVFSGNIGFHLNMYKIGPCKYEPELFPGAKFIFENKKLIINVFQSGKFVITGADNLAESQAAFESIRPGLENGRIGLNSV